MIGASQIEEAMNAALEFLVKNQHPNCGYFYAYKNRGPSNLSNASYNYQALKVGYAAGSTVPGLKKVIDKAIKHMQDFAKENVFYYRSDKSDPRSSSVRAVFV